MVKGKMTKESDDSDEGLKQFDKPFHETLELMARKINPKSSGKIRGLRSSTKRGFIGSIIDFSILLRRGFQQTWQFMTMIQALFIFLGLAPQVSESLTIIGINISSEFLVILAVVGIFLLVIFGMIMLLYGGSQRSKFLVNQKQNPAMRANFEYWRLMSRKILELEKKIDSLDEKVVEGG